jgi:hypothetical protein
VKYKTYAEIANVIDVDYCPSWRQCGGPTHVDGYVDDMNILHWTERRVTRSGIRRFLMLAWKTTWVPGLGVLPPWLQLWLQITWVRNRAKIDLHTIIPAPYWNESKARLASKIAVTRDTHYKEEKAKALRWAQR